MYQQLWGYKVEEKLYLGVREQKWVEYHCGREYLNNKLLNLINKCWQFARIPRTWYEAHVISLFKK
jgi:hypothetical protein